MSVKDVNLSIEEMLLKDRSGASYRQGNALVSRLTAVASKYGHQPAVPGVSSPEELTRSEIATSPKRKERLAKAKQGLLLTGTVLGAREDAEQSKRSEQAQQNSTRQGSPASVLDPQVSILAAARQGVADDLAAAIFTEPEKIKAAWSIATKNESINPLIADLLEAISQEAINAILHRSQKQPDKPKTPKELEHERAEERRSKQQGTPAVPADIVDDLLGDLDAKFPSGK